MKKIVTHGGQAHRDDLLACALLLSIDDSVRAIERRNPILADLSCVDTYVVDAGGQLDNSKRNLDHHHLSDGRDCALTLTLKHFNLFHLFEGEKWLDATCKIDNLGMARFCGLDHSRISFAEALRSPIEGAILALFSEVELVQEGSMLFNFLKNIGQEILFSQHEKARKENEAKEDAEFIEIETLQGVKFSKNFQIPQIQHVIAESRKDVVFFVKPCQRTGGLSLTRFNDSQSLDFRRLQGSGIETFFIHGNGFTATLKNFGDLEVAVKIAKVV